MSLTQAPEKLVQWQTQLLAQTSPALPHGASGRLKIYQTNQYQALLSCMSNVYQHCLHQLGHDFFYNIIKYYIRDYPLGSLNLNEYGEYFSQWLHRTTSVKIPIWLADLAQAQWHCHQLYYVKTAQRFDFNAYGALSGEQATQVVLYANKQLTLMQSNYDLLALFENEQYQKETHHSREYYFCIVKNEHHGQLYALTQSEFALLNRLQSGINIDSILITPELENTIHMVSNWIAKGWINRFEQKEDVHV